jgi:hypothetical protein
VEHREGPQAEQVDSAVQQMMAEVALKQIREAFDGRLVLYKGLELANRYEDPSERSSGDIDVITDDPDGLFETLGSLGYQHVTLSLVEQETAESSGPSAYSTYHHLWPLERPGWPVVIEVHRSPGWLPGMTPPTTAALLETAVPTCLGLDGIEALDPAAHGVCVAVHSWRDRPFARRRDLTDIDLLLDTPETASRADHLAADWGVARIWAWYRNAIAAAQGSQRAVPAVRLLGGDRFETRTSSKLADYLVRYAGRFLIDAPVQHRAEILRALRTDTGPLRGEPFRRKLRRFLGSAPRS